MSKKTRALIATAAVAGLVAAGLLIAFITNQTSGSTTSSHAVTSTFAAVPFELRAGSLGWTSLVHVRT